MKKIVLFLLVILSACKDRKNAETIAIGGHGDSVAPIEHIEKNLVPVHYLTGSTYKKSIQQIMKADRIAGVSIAFVDNGKIAWQRTYGYSQLEDSTAVTPHTVFNGASLSKPVTAMAALRLVELGTLNLNENVNNYLEGWKVPENEFTAQEKVTLKRLMGHTAGFDRYVQSSFYPDEALPTITQMLTGAYPSVDPAVSLIYVPGEKQLYSNPGYSVMEKLIEDVTDKQFNTVLTELIFEPCGMTESSFEQPVPDRLTQQMATGYSNDLQPYPYKLFPYKAAGGIWTTPTDLAKFLATVLKDHQLGSNTILSQQMTDSIFAKSPTRLGFAKIYHDESQDVLIEHWGSNSGFTCYMVASPKHNQALVIMTNSDNGMSLMSYITRAMAVEYDWDFFQPVAYDPITLDASSLTRFTGTFTGGNEVLEFRVTAGELHLIAPMGTSLKLVPVAENSFIDANDQIRYDFLDNTDGEVGFVRMTKADGYNNDYIKQ
jgi:CubicO group peptidase (beta-lactamase class C family)